MPLAHAAKGGGGSLSSQEKSCPSRCRSPAFSGDAWVVAAVSLESRAAKRRRWLPRAFGRRGGEGREARAGDLPRRREQLSAWVRECCCCGFFFEMLVVVHPLNRRRGIGRCLVKLKVEDTSDASWRESPEPLPLPSQQTLALGEEALSGRRFEWLSGRRFECEARVCSSPGLPRRREAGHSRLVGEAVDGAKSSFFSSHRRSKVFFSCVLAALCLYRDVGSLGVTTKRTSYTGFQDACKLVCWVGSSVFCEMGVRLFSHAR